MARGSDIWAKISVEALTSDAIYPLSSDAKLLWIASILWSRRKVSDGHIPTTSAPLVLAEANVPSAAIAELVTAGRWLITDDGWQIHDFAEHQDTKENVEARSAAAKTAIAKRWGDLGNTSRMHDADTERITTRIPEPDTERITECITESNTEKRREEIVAKATTTRAGVRAGVHARESQHPLVEVWNKNCGELPKARGLPSNTNDRRHLENAWAYADADAELFGRAVGLVAMSEKYRESQWGLTNFGRNSEQWIDRARCRVVELHPVPTAANPFPEYPESYRLDRPGLL